MPKYLTPHEIGLYRVILSAAALFAPIPLFGLRSAFMRFFPRNSDRLNSVLATTGFLIFGVLLMLLIGLAILFKPFIMNFFIEKAEAINGYLWLILVLVAMVGIHGFLESILKAKKNITLPSFVKEFVLKLLQAFAILLVGFSMINFHHFLVLQAFLYLILIVIIFTYLARHSSIRPAFGIHIIDKEQAKEFFTYSRYALLSGLGTAAVLQIDQIMISKYIGLEANAIYTIAVFMSVVVEMPRRFVAQITQPIITEDFKANRLEKINSDYKKVSINQLIIGSYIFLGVVINLPTIYAIMPNGNLYSSGISIVYIIGFAKLINMVFSINGEIIVMSDHYRVNILLIALLGLLTIIMNLLLIPKFGIEGAGYASLITFFLFNLAKFLYIKKKFNFSPFSKWTVPITLLIPLILLINSYFDYSKSAMLDLILRSSILSIFYLLVVYFAKPSKELSNVLHQVIKKIKKT